MQDELNKYSKYIGHFDYVDDFAGAPMVLQSRNNNVSHYLDFEKTCSKTPLSDDGIPRYAMNHPYDLLNLLRQKDNNVYINEALLASWSINEVIKHFREIVEKILPYSLMNITFQQLYDNPTNSGKIIDYYKLGPLQDGLVSFIFPFKCNICKEDTLDEEKDLYRRLNDESAFIAKKIVDPMFVTGYFLSFAEDLPMTKKMSSLGVGLCALQFEARYSRKVANLSKYLYHVSPSRYFSKIVKNGIVPYSKSENLRYPDRIYLFNNTYFEIIKPFGAVKSLQLLQQNCKWVNDKTFVVFAIDTSKLLNHHLYKDGKMVFYIDPCYDGKIGGIQMCEAIYTYSGIPQELIEDKCFVYAIEKDKGGKSNIHFDHLQMFPR